MTLGKLGFLSLAFSAIGLAATPVLAHATLEVRQAAAGAPYKAVVRIGHGCDGSPTTKVRVVVPEGVIGVKPMPKPGWTIETMRGAYARSYPYFHGAELAEGVKQVTWSGGKLPDDYYDEFVFAAFLSGSLPADSTIYFPVYQDCEAGSLAWADVPAAGQDQQALKSPAPGVKVLQVQAAGKTAAAPSTRLGPLVIDAPWTRATPGGVQVAGAYLKITNTGAEPDRLIGGASALASAIEVHEMSMTGGVMKMRLLDKGLEIKPGQTVELKPGGYHLMIMGLRQPLKQGQTLKGSLVFEKAGTVELEFRVAPLGAQSGGGGHSHH